MGKNRRKSVIGIFLFFIGCMLNVQGQDYTFSNHNIVPFSLNPALAGNVNAMRLGLNYRQQWPSLGNNYHTVRASYDQNIYKQMSAIGVSYTYDNMANGVFQTNEFALVYSHTFRVQEEMFVRLGLQASLFANFLNMNHLTFEDQYNAQTRQTLPYSIEELDSDRRLFPDFTFGACFVIENRFSIGGSVSHLAEPENGFAKLEYNKLHRKFAVHANFTQNLEGSNGLWGRHGILSEKYFFANASYQQQYDFRLAHLGIGFAFDPFIAGTSFKNTLGDINSLSFMLGGNYKGFQLYYIYDLPLYTQQNGSWSHELSLIYILQREEKYACPVVYW
jgi:type IX secretion system PorP/SprF family membrane protein